MFKFTIETKAAKGRARAGMIETDHGKIPTPAFIPVATKATVKSLVPEMIRDYVGADAVLANTYHLYLQPGTDVLEKAGGVGRFMNWSGPTFTDSGGFQAFSLSGPAKRASKISTEPLLGSSQARIFGGKDGEIVPEIEIDEEANSKEPAIAMAKTTDEGVTFRSVIDGSTHMFTPERSIEIQHQIGADMIFAFDECILPGESYERQAQAVKRTDEWAQRCLEEQRRLASESAKSGEGQKPAYGEGGRRNGPLSNVPALFGIVQGGRYEDLRRASAKSIGSMDFDGFGIGGSFDKNDIGTAVGWVADELPEGKPRHLLGIGSEPADLIMGIDNGMDTFDCVAPARVARTGSAYCRADGETAPRGRLNLMNAAFVSDLAPIDRGCACYTCKNYSRAYLSHLFRAKEMLAATLTTIHNLYFVVNLVKEARRAIIEGKWNEFRDSRFKIQDS